MDLRVQKTRKNILNAFIQLRSSNDLESISITELARLAMINKATFYLHYSNIYELSDSVENEIIQNVINGISPDLDYFEDPYHFTKCLINTFNSQGQIFRIIFSGSRYGVLADKVEKYIRMHFIEKNPRIRSNIELSIAISILIQGGFRVLNRPSQYNENERHKAICRISEQIISHYMDGNNKDTPYPLHKTKKQP